MEQRKFSSWNNEKMLFFEGNNRLTKQFSRRDNDTMNTLFDYCFSPLISIHVNPVFALQPPPPYFNPCKPRLCSPPPMLIRVNPVYRPMASPQILDDPLISSE